MDKINTLESVMEGFKKLAEKQIPIDPHQWMEGAMKLSALLPAEVDKLIEMEYEVSKMRKQLLFETENKASHAEILIKATPEYLALKKQEARIKGAQEEIRTIKKNATITSDLMRNSL